MPEAAASWLTPPGKNRPHLRLPRAKFRGWIRGGSFQVTTATSTTRPRLKARETVNSEPEGLF